MLRCELCPSTKRSLQDLPALLLVSLLNICSNKARPSSSDVHPLGVLAKKQLCSLGSKSCSQSSWISPENALYITAGDSEVQSAHIAARIVTHSLLPSCPALASPFPSKVRLVKILRVFWHTPIMKPFSSMLDIFSAVTPCFSMNGPRRSKYSS